MKRPTSTVPISAEELAVVGQLANFIVALDDHGILDDVNWADYYLVNAGLDLTRNQVDNIVNLARGLALARDAAGRQYASS